jgi:uncharacterized protein
VGFAAALAAFLALWNNLANLSAAFRRWYVAVNLLLAAALLAAGRTAGLGRAELGLDPAAAGSGLRWGGVVGAAVAAALAVASAVPALRRWLYDQRVAGMSGRELVRYAGVRIPLGTVVLEEVAFRGVLLAALAAHGSQAVAVIGSSTVFGLWHVTPTLLALRLNRPSAGTGTQLAVTAAAVVVTTAAGVGLCLLRLGSGSLLAPVLAHTAANSLAAVAAHAAVHRR